MTAAGPDSGQGQGLAFAQLLLSLIDEGHRTTTYKLAVLLALVDCCALGTDAAGRAPGRIATRDLARRVVELYWPQVRPFTLPGGDTVVLRQSSQPRALTVEAVQRLREQSRGAGATTPAAAERLLPGEFEAALDAVELNLVRMPLGKLQRPQGFSERSGQEYPRFLYDDRAFHEDVPAALVRGGSLAVVLEPGVGDWLVSFGGLFRPLLELHWAREVAKRNGTVLTDDGVRRFLFGADRENLARLRPGLLDAQDGRCFYCGGALRPGEVDVDHFVPWSRVPNDGLQNLVLADRRCNNSKRDHYADLEHLARWAARPETVLAQAADAAGWPLRRDESRRLARGLYSRLPDGTHLWRQSGYLAVLDRLRLPEALSALEDA